MKLFTKIIIATTLLLGINLVTVFAQNQRRGPSPDKENELIFASIEGLSKKQKEKIEKINVAYSEKFKALFEDAAGDRAKIREGRLKMMAEKESQIQNVLTKSQFEAYQKLMQEQREIRNQNRQNRRKRRANNG